MRVKLVIGDVADGYVGVDARCVDATWATLTRDGDARVVQLIPYADAATGTVYLSPMLALRFDRRLALDPFLKQRRSVQTATLRVVDRPEFALADRVYLQRIGLPTKGYSVTPTLEDLTAEALRVYFGDSKR